MTGIFFKDHPCTTTADAPALVLLHGWGMHSGVWQHFIPLLTPHFHVRCIDLPGYGRSAHVAVPDSLETLADLLLTVAPARAVWAGWSLGGLVALAFASRHGVHVSHLALLAATPCFVQRKHWQCAMSPQDFEAFAASLRQNAAATLKRFLALQCRGSISGKADLRFLQGVAGAVPVPAVPALMKGLELLRAEDWRPVLPVLGMPLLCLLGEKDELVPVAVAAAVSVLQASVMVRVIPAAAHAPFVSHPEICRDALLSLVQVPHE